MGILAWIVLGLVAGIVAKLIMPGDQPGGFLQTTLLGVAGALIGGFVGRAITGAGLSGFSLWSLLLAIVGAVALLLIYGAVVGRTGRRRPAT